VSPNRTQEILFGKTFRSALLCDQIGVALLGQATARPALLLTDEPVAVGLRRLVDVPMSLMTNAEQEPRNCAEITPAFEVQPSALQSAGGTPAPQVVLANIPSDHGTGMDHEQTWPIQIMGWTLQDIAGFEHDREIIRESLQNVESGFDLAEPFDRIRAAINEAQRAAA
jgi:hypothetical protein